MFPPSLIKIGKAGAWIIAVLLTVMLVWFMWNGLNNRYIEADSAGWAGVFMPFIALIPLACTFPFIKWTVYRLSSRGKVINSFVSLSIEIVVYFTFAWSLFITYNLRPEESPLIPVAFLCLSAATLIGSMFYGLMAEQAPSNISAKL